MVYKLLLLFCLYLPFQLATNPASGIDLASGRIIILIFFVLWLLVSLKDKKLIISSNFQTILIISFLFLSSFSFIFVQNSEWYLRKLLFLFSIFPLYFIIPAIANNFAKIKKIIEFLVWGAGGAAILGIIQFSLQFILGLKETTRIWANFITPFLGSSFSEAVMKNPSWLVGISGHDFFRAISVFPDPHMFSFYLNLILPWSLILYFSSGKKKLFLILFFLILSADLLTFSRGGYLGLISSAIITILFFRKKIAEFWKIPKYKYKKLTLVISAVFVITTLSVPNPISQRFFSSFKADEGSNQGRIENWTNSLSVITHNPLGVGLGNYSLEIKLSADYREPIYSHNLYFDIAAETGIINALVWIILIFSSIFSYLKKAKDNYFYLGGALGLISFFVHSFFETALFSTQVLPLLLIIIAVSTLSLNESDEKNY